MENAAEIVNMGLTEETEETLKKMAENNDLQGIRNILMELAPADAANAMELFEPNMQIALFRSLSKDTAAEIFTYVDRHVVEELLEVLFDFLFDLWLRHAFDDVYPEVAIDVCEDFGGRVLGKRPEQGDLHGRLE